MPAENYGGAGGTWRRFYDRFRGVGGSWRQIKEKYVGAGGVWRLVYRRQFTLVISSNTTYYKVRDALIAAGWDTVVPINVELQINLSVYVTPTSTATWAIDWQQALPTGSIIHVENRGIVAGKGGVGGNGGGDFAGATAGSNGGDAMRIFDDMTIDNIATFSGLNIISGFFLGGGGGGGGGGKVDT